MARTVLPSLLQGLSRLYPVASKFTLLVQICRVGEPSFCHSVGILAGLHAGHQGIHTIGRDG